MSDMRLYAFACGRITLNRRHICPGVEGEQLIAPMPIFLITHPKGNILFDTGPNKDVITDPVGRWGERFIKMAQPFMNEGDDVVSQLASVGYTPDDIAIVVNSHFHNDHCGGNQFFPKATFLVQKREMDAWRNLETRQFLNYYPADVDHPLRYTEVDGEHDVYGDGTVKLIPTNGHTPGHQSVLLNLPKTGKVLITGDGCYMRVNLEENVVPKIAFDREMLAQSLNFIRELSKRENAMVIFGHDPESWENMKRAPQYYE